MLEYKKEMRTQWDETRNHGVDENLNDDEEEEPLKQHQEEDDDDMEVGTFGKK